MNFFFAIDIIIQILMGLRATLIIFSPKGQNIVHATRSGGQFIHSKGG